MIPIARMKLKKLLKKHSFLLVILLLALYLFFFYDGPPATDSGGNMLFRRSDQDDYVDGQHKDVILSELIQKINDPELGKTIRATVDMTDKERVQFWDNKILEKNFLTEPPNPGFIFHNKSPKSGSTTMNNILKKMSRINKFNFEKQVTNNSVLVKHAVLVKNIELKMKKPYLLLKHESYLNFTQYGGEQPTYINVIREPLSWVTSRYYFSRFGWEGRQGCRRCFIISEEEKNMSIDECVEHRLPSCVKKENYLKYLCGDVRGFCNISDPIRKRHSTEIAKYNILNNFYFVGILERFEDTLNVFEALLPRYYSGAVKAWKSDAVQHAQNMTKTIHRKEMSQATADFLRNNQLKEEIELYNFAMKILERRMELLNIKPVPLL